MSKPVLTYFDIASRGELCRLALHAAGIDFEDKRFDYKTKEGYPEFKADKSNGSGQFFGQVPVFFIDNLKLCQGPAIATYINDKMFPTLTPEQRAIDNMFSMAQCDMATTSYRMIAPEDESMKERGTKDFMMSIDRHLEAFVERLLPDTGFIHGYGKPSLADLAVYDIMYSPTSGVKTLGFDTTKYSKVLALCDRVAAFPPIRKYLESGKRPTW